MRIPTIVCLAALSAFATLPGQETPVAVAAALARAGANRAEIERAWRDVPGAGRPAMAFLLEHLPEVDATTLAAAFLLREVEQALAARDAVPWGRSLPEVLFLNGVLPYAQANERREDWRTEFSKRFLPRARECRTPGEAARKLNETIFQELGVHYSTGRARAGQAPSESIAQGKASCTGLAILLADACRACCVPARLVSVRWPHKPGNHTWVEVWDGEAWRFCGADEPDPAGLDRGWFTADAARCAGADREHRVWAVSYAGTGERFTPGWSRDATLWGTDETARYAAAAAPPAADPTAAGVVPAGAQDAADAAVAALLDRWFAATPEARASFAFDRNLDSELRTAAGDARLRRLVFEALRRAERAGAEADLAARVARAGGKESPFTVKEVGTRPASGWPLVVAMHGGGAVRKEANDRQWRQMQVYYRDQPAAGGYLYVAVRAPTDEWNGFYTGYFYPVLERLIRIFVVAGGVDPDRVVAIGYSHGGYGAFAVGPKLPHRFAAVHASAAAPTDGESSPVGLHALPFSFMIGGRDRAHGRRERCEAFAALLGPLRAAHPGLYPATFSLLEDHGHSGLPDRDLLSQIVPNVRTAAPKALFWEPTDDVVKDHYWLRVAGPAKGQRVEARVDGSKLMVTTRGVGFAEAWLDARLCDLGRDLVLEVDGVQSSATPSPSLRTLCETMLLRGDPGLAATWIVPLR